MHKSSIEKILMFLMVCYCFSKDSGEAWTLDFVGRHITLMGSGIFVIDHFLMMLKTFWEDLDASLDGFLNRN